MGKITSYRVKRGSCEICARGARLGTVEPLIDTYQFRRHDNYKPPSLGLEKVPEFIWLCVDCAVTSQKLDERYRRGHE